MDQIEEDKGIVVFQVLNGVIVNTIVQPSTFEPDGEFYVLSDNIHGIGDKYDANTGEFSKVPLNE